MKKVKNADELKEEIKGLLDSIMSQTFYKCKHGDPQVRADANEINSTAHRCSILLDRFTSELKRKP
tara:strand:+ start:118 stop:315 length:198 start_codon:yes stop_codon:yes gene_type:complete